MQGANSFFIVAAQRLFHAPWLIVVGRLLVAGHNLIMNPSAFAFLQLSAAVFDFVGAIRRASFAVV
jgi:hypothetical protein